MLIRETIPSDAAAVRDIHARAFDQDEEADLALALLSDPSAEPRLSLLAEIDNSPAGHILFTAVTIEGMDAPPPAAILAPLAVLPDRQALGVGAALVRDGLLRLTQGGTVLVFVFGDPDYYGRFGFEAAWPHRFTPTHPVPPEYEHGWLVQSLTGSWPAGISGRVVCADCMYDPRYWGT